MLLALAATAYHAVAAKNAVHPDLIVGHGVLGRLIARIAALNSSEPAPVVWERNPTRAHGAVGYSVIDPAGDTRKDYRAVYDVSGDASLLDTLIARLAPGGEVVLAGFYDSLTFSFPAAFMREARLPHRGRMARRRTWLSRQRQLVDSGRIESRWIDHSPARSRGRAERRTRTAFTDPTLALKMVLDWRAHS